MSVNTEDDVKTRGQKEKLDEISAPAPDAPAAAEEKEEEEEEEEEQKEEPEENGDSKASAPPPKLPRDGTMVVTAKVLAPL